MDGFDVRRYAQANATFAGFEVEGRADHRRVDSGERLDLGRLLRHGVTPELDISGNDNLPLIPPNRVGCVP